MCTFKSLAKTGWRGVEYFHKNHAKQGKCDQFSGKINVLDSFPRYS